MPAIYLNESEVQSLLDMPTTIDLLEGAFRDWAADKAGNIPRARVRSPGMGLHIMSASWHTPGICGWKAYTTTVTGARFLIGIYHNQLGELLALLEANYLGQWRTGAASGLATKYLSRPDSKTVGVIGTGFQALTQILAVCAVRSLETINVFGRDPERRMRFATEVELKTGVACVPCESAETAIRGADIVITATTSATQVCRDVWLMPGVHINAIGSNYPQKSELDMATIERADLVVCDDRQACQVEAGELIQAALTGNWNWESTVNLADIVAGKHPGRTSPEALTIFKSVGLALEDVALGYHVWTRAKDLGLGTPLPF